MILQKKRTMSSNTAAKLTGNEMKEMLLSGIVFRYGDYLLSADKFKQIKLFKEGRVKPVVNSFSLREVRIYFSRNRLGVSLSDFRFKGGVIKRGIIQNNKKKNHESKANLHN